MRLGGDPGSTPVLSRGIPRRPKVYHRRIRSMIHYTEQIASQKDLGYVVGGFGKAPCISLEKTFEAQEHTILLPS